WADTHITLLEWLDLLCTHHHRLKTIYGWALIAGTGKRAFVPPDDPRHPRHHQPAHDRERHPCMPPPGELPAYATAQVSG
ncbi:MAG: hypothetical protein ACRDZ8_11570, partial [Acidimicrobiales bacterium]